MATQAASQSRWTCSGEQHGRHPVSSLRRVLVQTTDLPASLSVAVHLNRPIYVCVSDPAVIGASCTYRCQACNSNFFLPLPLYPCRLGEKSVRLMRPSLFSTLASDPGLGGLLTQQLLELVAQGKTPGSPRFNLLPLADRTHAWPCMHMPCSRAYSTASWCVTCNGVCLPYCCGVIGVVKPQVHKVSACQGLRVFSDL